MLKNIELARVTSSADGGGSEEKTSTGSAPPSPSASKTSGGNDVRFNPSTSESSLKVKRRTFELGVKEEKIVTSSKTGLIKTTSNKTPKRRSKISRDAKGGKTIKPDEDD